MNILIVAASYDIRYSSKKLTAANFDEAPQLTEDMLSSGTLAPVSGGEMVILSSSALNFNIGGDNNFAAKAIDNEDMSGAVSEAFPVTIADVYPPSPVLDLNVTMDGSSMINISFTAPGDDFDQGTG